MWEVANLDKVVKMDNRATAQRSSKECERMKGVYPWEAEPRTAVREPKLPGGASEISMHEESEGECQGGPNRWSADRAPKPPWSAVYS